MSAERSPPQGSGGASRKTSIIVAQATSTSNVQDKKTSAASIKSSATPKAQSKTRVSIATNIKPFDETGVVPDFIYGGPFIKLKPDEPFINATTPINIQLSGTYKKSYAYSNLKDRLPVILTKVIDTCSKMGGGEYSQYVQYVSKLKSDLVTNKKYDKLTVDTPNAKKWNEWIDDAPSPYYFTNTWVFTECYVYRRLREGCELLKGLDHFDPFERQKQESFNNSLEPMCIVAEKVQGMLPQSDKDKRKQDLMLLLKVCLWANKCDYSLSLGEPITLDTKPEPPPPPKPAPPGAAKPAGKGKAKPPPPPPPPPRELTPEQTCVDPFQMIIEYKDKTLVDDSGKVADNFEKNFEKNFDNAANAPPPPPEPEKKEGDGGDEAAEPPPFVPCPAKMVSPQAKIFDIICDNAGYELFTDLCFAHFMISQKFAQKIRFHVKQIPWFISDVTPKDFNYVVNACMNASFTRTVKAPDPLPVPEGQPEPPPEEDRHIDSGALREIAKEWQAFLDDGTFIVMSDEYWVTPHTYKDMKKYQYPLYRKLQFANAGGLYKGDLNYRKLLGERNCNPVQPFEPALQGYLPHPIIAVRTVKTDLICGLPKNKWEQLNDFDPKWMQKGDYGVIQFCPKAEPLKPGDKPCMDYGEECKGVVCPVHTDI